MGPNVLDQEFSTYQTQRHQRWEDIRQKNKPTLGGYYHKRLAIAYGNVVLSPVEFERQQNASAEGV